MDPRLTIVPPKRGRESWAPQRAGCGSPRQDYPILTGGQAISRMPTSGPVPQSHVTPVLEQLWIRSPFSTLSWMEMSCIGSGLRVPS